jgi:uncharacterized protein YjbI with pentapeptide repeats
VEQRIGAGNRAIWEALVVLGVLLVGFAIGFWYSEQRNAARYQVVTDELAKLEREENKAALREYFDQMARLLLERDLLDSQDGDEVQDLARARTLAAISASDAEDNKSLTRFLTDMDLVKGSDPVRLLQRSYLPNVDLSGAFLPAADLYVSSLRGADLSGAFLVSANLGGSILSDADLKGADLMYANLDHTELDGADLRDADLTRASLEEADLSGANLSGATVTKEQLDTCKSLTNATMPDGSRHP